MHANGSISLLSVVQLFPQLEETMVEPLKAALEHYEKVKEAEDPTIRVKKEVCTQREMQLP